MICLKKNEGWRFSIDEFIKSRDNIINQLKLPDGMSKKIKKDMRDFLGMKEIQYKNKPVNWQCKIIKIKDLDQKFPGLNVDWFKMINLMLLKRSAVSEDEEIFVENLELMQQILTALMKLSNE